MDSGAWEVIGAVGAAIVTVIGGLIMYAIRRQNDDQQRQIDLINSQTRDLYLKHQEDAERLHALDIKVAGNMLSRNDINEILREFKRDMAERFDRLEKKMEEQK